MDRKLTAQRIRTLRTQHNLTQVELAKLVGYANLASISNIERGLTSIPSHVLSRIATTLQTSADYLLGNTDDPLPTPATATLAAPSFETIPLLRRIADPSDLTSPLNVEAQIAVPHFTHADFAVRAEDDSMTGVSIYEGYIVLARRTDKVASGKVAALVQRKRVVLRRIYFIAEDYVELRADNPKYPIEVFRGEAVKELQVVGEVVSFIGTVV